MKRYGRTVNQKTGETGIHEIYTGMVLTGYAEPATELIQALCEHWNREDELSVAEWESLERLDLDADPFVIGRQARCIGAGCPYRRGTSNYDRFFDGVRLQDTLSEPSRPYLYRQIRDLEVFYRTLPLYELIADV